MAIYQPALSLESCGINALYSIFIFNSYQEAEGYLQYIRRRALQANSSEETETS
jgi:hypothetical protein